MSDLYRLVYTSYRESKCSEEEIQNILASCKKNNPKRNVTGILVHSDSRFIQYVEGEKDDLLKLYEVLKEDPRHSSLNQRNFEQIEQRVFPSWEMGYKDLPSKELNFHTDISTGDQKIFNELIKNKIDFDDEGMKVLQIFFRS